MGNVQGCSPQHHVPGRKPRNNLNVHPQGTAQIRKDVSSMDALSPGVTRIDLYSLAWKA